MKDTDIMVEQALTLGIVSGITALYRNSVANIAAIAQLTGGNMERTCDSLRQAVDEYRESGALDQIEQQMAAAELVVREQLDRAGFQFEI